MEEDLTREELLQELKLLRKEYNALKDSARAILNSNNFKTSAREIFDYCKRITGATSGYVALLSTDGSENEVLFLDSGGHLCYVDPSLPMPIRGLREKAYRTCSAVCENSFSNSCWVQFMPSGHVQLNNVLFAPLVIEQKTVGLIGLANKKGDFTQNDIDFASALGDIAAVALRNSRNLELLEENKEEYRLIFENSPAGILHFNYNGEVTTCNDALVKITGSSREELIGFNLLKQTDKKLVSAAQEVLNGRHGFYEGQPQLTASNKTFYVYIQFAPIINNGKVVGGECIVEDVTESKQVEKELKESEEKFRGLFNSIGDAVFIHDMEGNFLEVNQIACERLNYTREELVNMSPTEIDSPEYSALVSERIKELRQHGSAIFETVHMRRDGKTIPTEISGRVIQYRDKPAVISVARDITERKKAEEKIRYLSYHDQMTGLYNRTYLEEEMKRLDTERQLPISIIMADLNGLKLVNDTYGHSTGDEMLKRTAYILRDSCRKEDIIARWGGDEFVIFLPQTTIEKANDVCKRISNKCRKAYVEDIPVSIALGVSIKESSKTDLTITLKEAEDDMYKQKLGESRSARSAVLDALLKALEAKSFETRTHIQLMQEVAFRIGENLGLPGTELSRLSLVIKLHDIGEINVPEEVLTKNKSLTPEEWELIKKHPETGSRIARATEEFAHVAEDILAHHERWDGTGYPQGLKGEEIPLLARIMSIVDAYEVMSTGRPYKEPMSWDEIKTEFKKWSGTQFDPELVEIFLSTLDEKPHLS